MKAVVQRVASASLTINEKIFSRIDRGLLILLGISGADGDEDIQWLAKKIANLRIFADENNHMNKSVQDIGGSMLVVSQFTLLANTKKGNRPSFIDAAPPHLAQPLYASFIEVLAKHSDHPVQTGVFGADMQIELINDGPVTIIIDTKQK